MALPVDGALAELAGMWLAHRRSKAQGHRHPDSFIIKVKTQVCHGWGLNPSGSVRLCGGEEASSGHLVGPI